MPRISKLVSSCKGCNNYVYDSGSQYKCQAVDQPVIYPDDIASFCPLLDYPASVMAGMEQTIRSLREPNKYSLAFAIVSYIATILKLNLDTRGNILIPVKDGKSIYFSWDRVENICDNMSVVYFYDGEGKKCKLHPNPDKPMIYRISPRTIEGEDVEYWSEIYPV